MVSAPAFVASPNVTPPAAVSTIRTAAPAVVVATVPLTSSATLSVRAKLPPCVLKPASDTTAFAVPGSVTAPSALPLLFSTAAASVAVVACTILPEPEIRSIVAPLLPSVPVRLSPVLPALPPSVALTLTVPVVVARSVPAMVIAGVPAVLAKLSLSVIPSAFTVVPVRTVTAATSFSASVPDVTTRSPSPAMALLPVLGVSVTLPVMPPLLSSRRATITPPLASTMSPALLKSMVVVLAPTLPVPMVPVTLIAVIPAVAVDAVSFATPGAASVPPTVSAGFPAVLVKLSARIRLPALLTSPAVANLAALTTDKSPTLVARSRSTAMELPAWVLKSSVPAAPVTVLTVSATAWVTAAVVCTSSVVALPVRSPAAAMLIALLPAAPPFTAPSRKVAEVSPKLAGVKPSCADVLAAPITIGTPAVDEANSITPVPAVTVAPPAPASSWSA